MTAAAPSHDTERRAIEATVQTYFDGLYEGDADKLASVFHQTSALSTVQDGKLVHVPRDAWLDMVRSRPSAKAKSLPRHDQIVSLEITGPTLAFVRVKCQIPPRYFTDQLSLLKVDGKWLIAQKAYQTDTR